MSDRDKNQTERFSQRETRGAPYRSTTRRGDVRKSDRPPLDPRIATYGSGTGSSPPTSVETPSEAFPEETQATAEAYRTGFSHAVPKTATSRAKATGGRPPAGVIALVAVAVGVFAVGAILIGRYVLSPGRAPSQGSGEAENARPGPSTPGSQTTGTGEKRLVFGKYAVNVPDGWEVVSRTDKSLVLKNAAIDATLEIRFDYHGSHSDLRPSCQSSPTSSPTTGPSPTTTGQSPTPSPTPTSTPYTIFAESPVAVLIGNGQMQKGRLSCAGSDPIDFATVVFPQPAIGLGYRGDPIEFEFILPDLIEQA